MDTIINVEKIMSCKCHGHKCSFCGNLAVNRLYTKSEIEYSRKKVAFYFCESCGTCIGKKLIEYSK